MKHKFYTWVTASTIATMMTFSFGFAKQEVKPVPKTVGNVVIEQYAIKPEVTIEKVFAKQEVKKQEATTTFHKVKTEYLNVRRSNNKTSKIIDVLVHDYIVESDSKQNGWLKLKSGGYVNGRYVTTIEPSVAKKLLAEQNKKPKPKPVFHKPKPAYKDKTKRAAVAVKASKPTGVAQIGVTTPSNVSAEHFNQIVAGTGLSGIGHAIVAVEEQYGINGFFTLAVAKLESGNGTSRLAQNKNNIFGMNAVDSNPYNAAFTYDSKAHSVLDFGRRLKQNYIDQGFTTLPEINSKYSSSPAWTNKVNEIMHGDLNKVY